MFGLLLLLVVCVLIFRGDVVAFLLIGFYCSHGSFVFRWLGLSSPCSRSLLFLVIFNRTRDVETVQMVVPWSYDFQSFDVLQAVEV